MRFAHLSDFHYTKHNDRFPDLRTELVSALAKLINDLSTIQQRLDFISITGDLTEAGDAESYTALSELLSCIHIPVLLIPGNHDSRQSMSEVFTSEFRINGRVTLDYYTVIDDMQVIGLDTLDAGEVGGRLTSEQLLWLEDLLLQDEFTHSVISMHHPPFPIGQAGFDAIAALEGRDQFAKLLRQSRSEIIVLSGHVHRPYHATWNRASCHIAGAPSLQMGAQFCFGNDPLEVVDEPYAYFIHDIDRVAGHRMGMRYVKLTQVPAAEDNHHVR